VVTPRICRSPPSHFLSSYVGLLFDFITGNPWLIPMRRRPSFDLRQALAWPFARAETQKGCTPLSDKRALGDHSSCAVIATLVEDQQDRAADEDSKRRSKSKEMQISAVTNILLLCRELSRKQSCCQDAWLHGSLNSRSLACASGVAHYAPLLRYPGTRTWFYECYRMRTVGTEHPATCVLSITSDPGSWISHVLGTVERGAFRPLCHT